MRYLSAAFWARPSLPLLRLLPWNALAVVAAAVAGWFDPSLWMTAGLAELIYLTTMSTNGGFRRSVDETRVAFLNEDTDETRHALLSQLGGSARQRHVRLEEKRKRLESTAAPDDDLLAESDRSTLRRLSWLHLQLLTAQRNVIALAPKSDRADLEQQIAALEAEIGRDPGESTLRSSREATLQLTRERLRHIRERENSLVEIDSDLARIEAQYDVALGEASLRGHPASVAAAVDVTSQMLGPLDSEKQRETE